MGCAGRGNNTVQYVTRNAIKLVHSFLGNLGWAFIIFYKGIHCL